MMRRGFSHRMIEPETTLPPPGDLRLRPGVVRPPRFSEEIERLRAAFAERAVTLREVLEVTSHRGYIVLLILLAIPFCTPIPLPGISTPFGLVIAFIGLRFALGQKAWLPARLLDVKLPPRFLPRVLQATAKLVRGLERFLKPRLCGMLRWRFTHRVIGAIICAAGLLLTLPVPIPFSNALPALAILLLAAALLEEDGCVALLGGVIFVVAVGFFTAIFLGGAEAVAYIRGALGLLPESGEPAAEP